MKRLALFILILVLAGCGESEISGADEILVPERNIWSNCGEYMDQLGESWDDENFGVDAMFPTIPGEGDWCGGSSAKSTDRYITRMSAETLVDYLMLDLHEGGYSVSYETVTERIDDKLYITETKIKFDGPEGRGEYRIFWKEGVVDIVERK